MILQHFSHSDFVVVASDGREKGAWKGVFGNKGQSHTVMTEDMTLDVDAGDEIRRALPNNKEDVFEVADFSFSETFHGIPAHYTVKLRRKGMMPRGTGGNYVHVTGPNARVVIGSTDNSTNTYGASSPVYGQVRDALQGVGNVAARQAAEEALARMEQAADGKSRLGAYQDLIAAVADYVPVIAPFLPGLTALLSS